MIAGLFSGILFLAFVAVILIVTKPWKKEPKSPAAEPGVPVKAPEPK